VVYTVTATDPDNPPSDLTITCDHPSGSTFAIGTTTVICTATDPAGNTSSGGFQITVVDVTPPTLQLPSNITANATSPAGASVVYTVTATDPDNPPSDLTITCNHPSGGTFAIGTTTVTCTATDPTGNTSTGGFHITVLNAADQLGILYKQVQDNGLSNGLASKVAAAQSALARGNTNAACGNLTLFISQVQAQSASIGPALAAQLIAEAKQIKAVIGC
jgi:hypothetical protein